MSAFFRFVGIGSHRFAVTVLALAAATCLLAGPAVGSAAAAKPENNFPPEVRGNPAVGERAVCGAGSWTGEISEFSYQWLRDGTVVGTELTYRIATADDWSAWQGRGLSGRDLHALAKGA